MMKKVLLLSAALTLSGCEAVRTLAPQTTAGFETGGLIGAIDGATGAILARCRTVDGLLIRVAIDGMAAASGSRDLVGEMRSARREACARAARVNTLVVASSGATSHDVSVNADD